MSHALGMCGQGQAVPKEWGLLGMSAGVQGGGARSMEAESPDSWPESASQSAELDENQCNLHESTPQSRMLASKMVLAAPTLAQF